MNKLYITGEPPGWCQAQIEQGRIIHVAARPLYGDETNNTMALPPVHGRHYAALDPAGKRYDVWHRENEELDARELVYVPEQAVLQAAFDFYQERYAAMLDKNGIQTVGDIAQSKYLPQFLKTGLEVLNGRRS